MTQVDLKAVMKSIDTRDTNWYNSLSDDEKKDITIWQLMRFTSSCNSKIQDINYHYLTMTNEIVNRNFNILNKHPELQFRLLQTVGIGNAQFHPWIKPPKSKKKDNLTEYLKTQFPECNDDEIQILSSKDKSEIKVFLLENGLDDKSIKEILK